VPYETVTGSYERASRTSHAQAAVRALAEQASFHVPAEHLRDLSWLATKVRPRSEVAVPQDALRLSSAIAIDGSRDFEQVRDGLPSVVYGFAQAAAAYVDLGVMEHQQAEQFIDPAAIEAAVNTALALAMYGPPAKLRSRAETYFQAMTATTPGNGPYICGLEKSGTMVDYARQLARHDVLKPGDLLICDEQVIAAITNTDNAVGYSKETYWARKFVYRAKDGRVVVPTVPPATGHAYDRHGGQPDPGQYPTLPAILDVIDRTGSSMYQDGVLPGRSAPSRPACGRQWRRSWHLRRCAARVSRPPAAGLIAHARYPAVSSARTRGPRSVSIRITTCSVSSSCSSCSAISLCSRAIPATPSLALPSRRPASSWTSTSWWSSVQPSRRTAPSPPFSTTRSCQQPEGEPPAAWSNAHIGTAGTTSHQRSTLPTTGKGTICQ